MKKNDKIKILFIIVLFSILLTWFIAGGTYNESGVFTLSKITRAGVFDFFLILFYSLYYNITNIFYLLMIGGCYGILSKTKSYRKLIDKTVSLVKKKVILYSLLTTFITALFVSFTSNAFVVLAFVPFIFTVFLKCNKDRITAISTAIGGIFIGMIGNTFGTYGVSNLMGALDLKYTQGIGYKIAIFIIAYVLYNLFAIMHINKQYKDVDETEYNLYDTEKLDEKLVKKVNKTKIWPIVTISITLIIVTILAYINWKDSFGIQFFEDIETGFEGIKIKGIPILYSLAGSTTAFGSWKDTLGAGTILFLSTLLIALTNKVKINEFIDNYITGMKNMIKVAITVCLAYSVFIILMWYGWPYTLVNALIGNGKFNMFTIFLAGIIISLFAIDKDYIGYSIGAYLATAFSNNLLATSILINSASSIIAAIAPTSIILIIGLSMLDIPYKKWLAYIWKYVVAMTAAILIIVAIMCYM